MTQTMIKQKTKPMRRNTRSHVKTMSVKVLTVDHLQVTPEMIWQLPEEALIQEEDGKLRGLPLGTVHCPSTTCLPRKHWHVIWQKHGKLRWATVEGHPKDWPDLSDSYFIPELAEWFVKVLVCEVYDGILIHSLPNISSDDEDHFCVNLDVGNADVVFVLERYCPLYHLLGSWEANSDPTRVELKALAEIRKDLNSASIRGRRVSSWTSAELWAKLQEYVDDRMESNAQRRQGWKRSMTKIEALPQLFIAV